MRSRVKYNKDPSIRRWVGVLLGGLFLLAAGWVVVNWPPVKWWVEAGVVLLTGLGLYLIRGWKLATGILSFLLLQRFGILNFWTLGVFIIILGLISLIN